MTFRKEKKHRVQTVFLVVGLGFGYENPALLFSLTPSMLMLRDRGDFGIEGRLFYRINSLDEQCIPAWE
jgi:hypothetical protein